MTGRWESSIEVVSGEVSTIEKGSTTAMRLSQRPGAGISSAECATLLRSPRAVIPAALPLIGSTWQIGFWWFRLPS